MSGQRASRPALALRGAQSPDRGERVEQTDFEWDLWRPAELGPGACVGCVAGATAQVIYEASAGDAVAVRQAIAELDGCLGPRPTAFHSLAGDLAKTYASLCRGERAEAGLRDVLVRGRDCGYGVFVGSRVISRLVSAAFDCGIEIEHTRELQLGYELEPAGGPVGFVSQSIGH